MPVYEVNEWEKRADLLDQKITEILSQLETLVEINMALMVQLTKVYDVAAFTAVADVRGDQIIADTLEEMLDKHEEGLMASTEPLLKGFAARNLDV